jgi:3-methylcrotonyl-CoA carboxylase alpha subunit
LTEVDVIARAGDTQPTGGRLTAPMPGKLIALHVKAGDAVKAGQALAVMEAMKMEHTLTCPRDGVVTELLYAVGDQLSDGAELLKLAEA